MEADTFLKIWAVVGPLLAAAGSALWARHLQLQDRQRLDARENAAIEREDRRKKDERIAQTRQQLHDEARSVIAKFMSSSHLFVRKQTGYLNNLADDDRRKAADLANDDFSHLGQMVVLLADHELENATIDLWNASLALPRPASLAAGDEYTAVLESYRRTRAVFNQQAKRFLAELSRADA
jgi:hypothetical protein